MAEISKIYVQGIEYDIEDSTSRQMLSQQKNDVDQFKIDLEKVEQKTDKLPTFVLDGTTLTITAP